MHPNLKHIPCWVAGGGVVKSRRDGVALATFMDDDKVNHEDYLYNYDMLVP